MSHVVRGRCQSGKRWFWYAALWTFGDGRHCGDPVCEPGIGGHAYGWEDTEQQAIKFHEGRDILGRPARKDSSASPAPQARAPSGLLYVAAVRMMSS